MNRPLSVLALSPHLDDAVFSAGSLLHRLAAAGHRVVIATLFTRSVPDPGGFALACQLDKGLGPEIDYMALRREEDRVACARLGAVPHWCDLPEAPHRGYRDAASLFTPPHPADDAALPPLLDAELDVLLAAHAPDLLLAPQAIGAHVDHVQLVRALDRVLERRSDPPPVLWWRDFPYVSRDPQPREPFAARFRARPERAATAVGDPAAGPKYHACAAYRSQLGFQFGGEPGLHRALAAAGPREWFRASGSPLAPVLATLLDPA